MLILTALILLSFVNLTIANCPSYSYPIPPELGSNHSCVFISNTGMAFDTAVAECSSYGTLFTISNGFVNEFITGLLKKSNVAGYGFWIGVTNIVAKEFKNIDDGSSVNYTNWAPGESDNGSVPIAVYVDKQGQWYGSMYFGMNYYLCAVPQLTNKSWCIVFSHHCFGRPLGRCPSTSRPFFATVLSSALST
ncbi:hypothetical protein FO519_009773 [Halicephalobus sp. NKZ332]|nr:hypothetical protein FO519_009773 [Halicephalobus sp. NKZ332]